ncbi:uncharacterized protein A1O5_11152 [Cladophialophora psammophila CBS 110553]|uniref:Uncharacterized protein n=1 Tax=Cladophialophora psammophila CBS 110553 TaxID=1182543 RepID=W9WKV3_9EURO|nr:uncharacterized protein A1O5_11152 [Cladophialophora psammophila CBS 110553]EXJ65625.1 hypothetical protein A1O5_11152 [Cladophialophora psammophila CBS 110553]
MILHSRQPNLPTSSAIAGDEGTSVAIRKKSQSHTSQTLIASMDVAPKWSVWPFLRVIPWGIGPLLEIIANFARYTVTFEDVTEFIGDSIVYEY